jgi:hypothetical protein
LICFSCNGEQAMSAFVVPLVQKKPRVPIITIEEIVDSLALYLPTLTEYVHTGVEIECDSTLKTTTITLQGQFEPDLQRRVRVRATIEGKAASKITAKLWADQYAVRLESEDLDLKLDVVIVPHGNRTIAISKAGLPKAPEEDQLKGRSAASSQEVPDKEMPLENAVAVADLPFAEAEIVEERPVEIAIADSEELHADHEQVMGTDASSTAEIVEEPPTELTIAEIPAARSGDEQPDETQTYQAFDESDAMHSETEIEFEALIADSPADSKHSVSEGEQVEQTKAEDSTKLDELNANNGKSEQEQGQIASRATFSDDDLIYSEDRQAVFDKSDQPRFGVINGGAQATSAEIRNIQNDSDAAASEGVQLLSPPDTLMRCAIVKGDGAFEFTIVGESHYQRELELIAGGRCKDGARYLVAALLVPEPSNFFDRYAVAVQIDKQTVGYLSFDAGPALLEALAAGEFDCAACAAAIVGGWDRGEGDTDAFGVRLDAVTPFVLMKGTQPLTAISKPHERPAAAA